MKMKMHPILRYACLLKKPHKSEPRLCLRNVFDFNMHVIIHKRQNVILAIYTFILEKMHSYVHVTLFLVKYLLFLLWSMCPFMTALSITG